jgi:hypothetical protein
MDYSPLAEDSVEFVRARLDAGLAQFAASGLSATAWETPHYAASPLDYLVFGYYFPLTIHRVIYADELGHTAGQFYPYEIEQDVYGQRILPENLGNVEPLAWQGYPPRLPQDILRAARKNRALRDGWASTFFHPYNDLSYLRELVSGIKALGFTFVPLTAAATPSIVQDPQSQTNHLGATVILRVMAAGANPLQYQWFLNGTNLPQATNTTLILNSLSPDQTGSYTVRVINFAGVATSQSATIQLADPAMVNVRLEQNLFLCSFRTMPDWLYAVEYKPALNDALWLPFTNVLGDGSVFTVRDPKLGHTGRFYRIRLTQCPGGTVRP